MPRLRSFGRRLCQLMVVSGFVFSHAPLAAAPKPDAAALEQAKAAMRRGMSAFAAGDADAALTEYQRAQKLVPDANIPYRYAAEALIKLGRYPEAVDSLVRYLALTPDANDAEAVRTKIEELRAKQMKSTLAVRCEPKGAQIFVDDATEPLGQTPLEPVSIAPGKHLVRVQASDRQSATLSVDVKPGGNAELTCSLPLVPPAASASVPPRPTARPSAAPPASAQQAPDRSPKHDGNTMKMLGWVGLGAGAATLVTAAVLDSAWLGAAVDTFHNKVDAGDAQALSWKNKADDRRVAVAAIYGVGGLVTLTGVALLLWPRSAETRPEAWRAGAPLLGVHPNGVWVGWSKGF